MAVSALPLLVHVGADPSSGEGAECSKTLPSSVSRPSARTPYGPFVRLALLTGARRGELLGLRWADVDFDGGALHIQQTAQRIAGQGIVFRQPKTRLSRRAIALSPDAVAVLRGHRRRQAELRLLAGPAYLDRDLVSPLGSERRSSRATCADRG